MPDVTITIAIAIPSACVISDEGVERLAAKIGKAVTRRLGGDGGAASAVPAGRPPKPLAPQALQALQAVP